VAHPDPAFELPSAYAQAAGVWRFGAALPAIAAGDRITLGEAGTPLIALERAGRGVLAKLEHLQPSGSYKDRGAAVLVSVLRALGVSALREDSSGNAAASLAAYAAAAEISYGNLLLGLWDAFTALRRADPAVRPPRLFGVQAEAFSAVAAAWRAGAPEVTAGHVGETMAEGIRSLRPVRDRRVLAAVRASGGAVVSVGEREIASALAELLARGVYVEPTSAVAWAGLERVPPLDGECVVVLTGSGLKAPGAIERAVGPIRAAEHGQARQPDHDAGHGAEP
jgi:threonine synthase